MAVAGYPLPVGPCIWSSRLYAAQDHKKLAVRVTVTTKARDLREGARRNLMKRWELTVALTNSGVSNASVRRYSQVTGSEFRALVYSIVRCASFLALCSLVPLKPCDSC